MVIPSSSDKPETLNELTRLRDSGFGRPRPRHGLRLLYWLAFERISYDSSSAILLCMPKRGDYGFHYFKNRENILPSPKEEYFYYEVGNLNKPNAQALPSYIRVNYDWNSNWADRNSDRVILSVGPGNIIDRIYVTKHQGKGSFDRERTYRISKGLMNKIKNLELSAFLHEMGEDPDIRQTNQAYAPPTVNNMGSISKTPDNVAIPVPESHSPPQPSRGFWDYCTIL